MAEREYQSALSFVLFLNNVSYFKKPAPTAFVLFLLAGAIAACDWEEAERNLRTLYKDESVFNFKNSDPSQQPVQRFVVRLMGTTYQK